MKDFCKEHWPEIVVVLGVCGLLWAFFHMVFGSPTAEVKRNYDSNFKKICLHGYVHIKIPYEMSANQLFDENGNGIPCRKEQQQ